ncbi:MAG: ATP-dependent DNA helicase RecG [Proteobacteria bacterium]|jgi:ATP-dependent DNA helicase RecG|nr:ATP-dependent DNA helicase RecG [Pseudomonadota bacterium]
MDINQSVTSLKGVGPAIAAKMEKIGVSSLQDVLFHLPLRYVDKTTVTPIRSLRHGDSRVVVGQIDGAQIAFGRRRSLLVGISDDSGHMLIRMFFFSRAQQRALQPGKWVWLFGEARLGAKGIEMIHPEYRVSENIPETQTTCASLTPIYPSTEGVSQAVWMKITDQVLDGALDDVQELLPSSVLEQFDMPQLANALREIHRPAKASLDDEGAIPADMRERLVFEELLAQHLGLRQLREQRENKSAVALDDAAELQQTFLSALPFDLTSAQQRVAKEISSDLERDSPMNRLVQGDVGSGKTVVAALALLKAVVSNGQAALMAPTELLAEQHLKNISHWFEPLGIQVAWLSGKQKKSERQAVLQGLQSGEFQLVVGTHALFQDGVEFDRLLLIIIDEQHRFGVEQRLALRNKGLAGKQPHQLIMTATPIPRTLAMAFYADIDVSSIDELPPGRMPVETVVVSDNRRPELIGRVREACSGGQQTYWVCPLIDESEVLQAQAATDTADLLAKEMPDISVALVHGRMKPAEKESVMQRFRDGEVQLLVATTVIEVGVDVPSASLMVIENAERLGLSQLHQLRGRVGRGSQKSVCLLMYHGQLGQNAKQRLTLMRETNDGFEIARKDLEMRGPGEMLGTRQTGELGLRIANVIRDQHWLPVVERIAGELLRDHRDVIQPLTKRWLAHQEVYGNV